MRRAAGAEVQAAFRDGIDTYIRTFTVELDAPDADVRRQTAVAMIAQMVGALALSRAVAKASPALSDEILAAGREGDDAPAREEAKEVGARRGRSAVRWGWRRRRLCLASWCRSR